jgi:hypothetical protein
MGILHDLLKDIHLVHDNALALADPAKATTAAHHGFFGATADLVHGLESRVLAIENALFGEQTSAPATPVTEPTPPAPAPSTEPSSTEPVAAAPAPAVEPAPVTDAQPNAPVA